MDERPIPSRSTFLETTGTNLALDAVTAEVVTALRAAGIDSVLLKGPSFGRWLYDPNEPRPSGDVDLLLPPGRLGEAERALERLGFSASPADSIPYHRPKHALPWRRAGSAVEVDVHRTLPGIESGDEEAWTVLAAETQEAEVGGAPVRVLAPEARALHLALVQIGTPNAKVRGDLERALERLPEDVWRRAADLAARLDATAAFAAGLATTPEGEALLERLAVSRETTTAVALRAQGADLAEGLVWLAQLPGLRAKAVFVTRHLFPPTAYLRVWSPLARRSRVGLVLAFAWRPLWVLLHLGPALQALTRARRGAEPQRNRGVRA